MDPRDLPSHISSKLVPGLVNPDDTTQCISLQKVGGYKRLAEYSIGANARGAKHFRKAYSRWVEPLFEAFEREHGLTPLEAMTRRYEPDKSAAREQLKLDLQKARAEGAREARQQTQQLLTKENALSVYGNRMSLSRYTNQRLALYFEVSSPGTTMHAHAPLRYQKCPPPHPPHKL